MELEHKQIEDAIDAAGDYTQPAKFDEAMSKFVLGIIRPEKLLTDSQWETRAEAIAHLIRVCMVSAARDAVGADDYGADDSDADDADEAEPDYSDFVLTPEIVKEYIDADEDKKFCPRCRSSKHITENDGSDDYDDGCTVERACYDCDYGWREWWPYELAGLDPTIEDEDGHIVYDDTVYPPEGTEGDEAVSWMNLLKNLVTAMQIMPDDTPGAREAVARAYTAACEALGQWVEGKDAGTPTGALTGSERLGMDQKKVEEFRELLRADRQTAFETLMELVWTPAADERLVALIAELEHADAQVDGPEKAFAITPEIVRKYVDSGGAHCPKCGSDDIEADRPEIDGASGYCPIACLACGYAWRDYYALSGIDVLDQDTLRYIDTVEPSQEEPDPGAVAAAVDALGIANVAEVKAALLSAYEEDELIELLDGIVHDAVSNEGSAINNGGLDAQLDYLVNECGETAKSLLEQIVGCANAEDTEEE